MHLNTELMMWGRATGNAQPFLPARAGLIHHTCLWQILCLRNIITFPMPTATCCLFYTKQRVTRTFSYLSSFWNCWTNTTCFPFPYITGLSFPTLFVSKWIVVWAIYWMPLALEPRRGKLTSILVLWGSSHHSENGALAVPAGFPKLFIAWITLFHCLWLTVCTSFSQCCVLVCGLGFCFFFF